MNWIRIMNRLFGARIQINEPDRVQFQTNKSLDVSYHICYHYLKLKSSWLKWNHIVKHV